MKSQPAGQGFVYLLLDPVDQFQEAPGRERDQHADQRGHNEQGPVALAPNRLLNGFFVLTAWVLGVALAVLVITVLLGPYRWAVATRSSVKRTWRSISQAGSGDHRGVVGWLASHAAGFQLGGAVVAGILLLIVTVSWLSFLIIGMLLAAYEACLQWIKPSPPDEALTAGPDNQAGVPSRTGET